MYIVLITSFFKSLFSQGRAPQPSLQDLGIFDQRPRRQEMAVLARRMDTYNGWPEDCPVKADDAARAGFVFQGLELFCY